MESTEYKKIEEFEKEYWWHQGRFYLLRSLISKYLPASSSLKLFEVGCGTGGTISLLNSFGNAEGMDISEDAINYCKSKGFLNVFSGDINTYNLDRFHENFDGVFALDVLEHIQEDILALRRIRKIIKPDGLLFISVPAHKFLWGEHDEANQHKRRYHLVEIEHKLSLAGFTSLKSSYFVLFAFFPMLLFIMWKNVFKKSAIPESNYLRIPIYLNNLGIQILKFETWLFNIIKLPFGTSIVIVAKKSIDT